MSVLAESILDTFPFDTSLVWATTGPAQATARFELDSSRVEVAFRETAKNEWQVSYTVAATTIKPTMEWLSDSILIICGVFLAVIEFLEVRQPERLLFDKEHQDLVELFEAYLNGPDTDLKHMGYGRRPAAQISSVPPFRVEKRRRPLGGIVKPAVFKRPPGPIMIFGKLCNSVGKSLKSDQSCDRRAPATLRTWIVTFDRTTCSYAR